MPLRELGMSWTEVWLTAVTAVGVYTAMIVFSRIFGQRQFATTATYDLAFVFAMGSLVGRVLLVRTSLANAVLGLVVMFGLHSLTGWAHHNIDWMHRLIQNRPILLVANGRPLDDNIRRAHTSRLELYQQVRQHGYGSFDRVAAVVLERDGTVSVLGDDERLDPDMLGEVVGRERVVDA